MSYSGAVDVDLDSASELDANPVKSKYKPSGDCAGKARRPPLKKSGSRPAGDGGSQNFLLTAAEQRTLEKKSDKKEKDDPFLFLQDIRDVRYFVPLHPFLIC